MAGLGFSPESSWLQKELIFLWPKPTAWITTTKLFEDFSRLTVRQVESPHVGGSKLSFAVTLFTCRSVSNPEQEAFVKVYKPVPHVGTEFDSHQARRAQAGEKNPRRHRCLQAFHGSTSTRSSVRIIPTVFLGGVYPLHRVQQDARPASA